MKKISTPRGEGRSMTPLSPTNVTVNYGETGADWFSPLQPMRPIAPPEVGARTWDFPTGFNLNTTPRPYEPVSFQTLRNIADAYDPLRIVIERRKDQLCRLSWQINARHDGPGKRPKSAQLPAHTRDLIADVTAFFKKPSFDLSWRSWLRKSLEDVFVIDGLSIFCERSNRGDLIGLRVVDGSTVKVNIDDDGNTPRPVEWDGTTSFVWNGGEVNPENFLSLGWHFHAGLAYPPAYTRILKGVPAANLSTRELIYRPMNPRPGRAYGMSPVEQVLMTAGVALRRISSQSEYFEAGNVPAGVLSLPEAWSPDQVSRFQDYWDSLFLGNLGNRRQMRFVAGGGKYQPFVEPNLKADFDEWLIRIICYAFSVPPTPFVELNTKATAKEHSRTAELEGLRPVQQFIEDLINEIIQNEWRTDEILFSFVTEEDADGVEESKRLTRLAESGILTLNQCREKLGEDPDPNPFANKLMVRTPTGYIPVGDQDAAADDNGGDDDDDAAKLRKRAPVVSTMLAPLDWEPCEKITIGSMTFYPDVKSREIKTNSAAAILALEAKGWTRKSNKQN